MEPSKYYTFKDFDAFLQWLKDNHDTENEAYLFIYKKNAEKSGITYVASVLAALCYGWIDSVKRSYDEEKYVQRFTPRRDKSNWCISNIKRMKRLIEDDLMSEAGLRVFDVTLIDKLPQLIAEEEARKTSPILVPDEVMDLIKQDHLIYEKFLALSDGHKRRYLDWINTGKRLDTRIRRAEKMIGMLRENRSINEML